MTDGPEKLSDVIKVVLSGRYRTVLMAPQPTQTDARKTKTNETGAEAEPSRPSLGSERLTKQLKTVNGKR